MSYYVTFIRCSATAFCLDSKRHLRLPASQQRLHGETCRLQLVELSTPTYPLLQLRCRCAWSVRAVLCVRYVLAPARHTANRLVALACWLLLAQGRCPLAAAMAPVVPACWSDVRIHPCVCENYRRERSPRPTEKSFAVCGFLVVKLAGQGLLQRRVHEKVGCVGSGR